MLLDPSDHAHRHRHHHLAGGRLVSDFKHTSPIYQGQSRTGKSWHIALPAAQGQLEHQIDLFLTSHLGQRPLGVNLRPFLQFVLFTCISCPPNILWQDFLEDKFPGYTYDVSSGTKSLDKANTARKFLFDQTLGAFINTLAFVGAMAAFKGKSLHGIQRELERVRAPHVQVHETYIIDISDDIRTSYL